MYFATPRINNLECPIFNTNLTFCLQSIMSGSVESSVFAMLFLIACGNRVWTNISYTYKSGNEGLKMHGGGNQCMVEGGVYACGHLSHS